VRCTIWLIGGTLDLTAPRPDSCHKTTPHIAFGARGIDVAGRPCGEGKRLEGLVQTASRRDICMLTAGIRVLRLDCP
jgi:hypothetical protein